jgi:hypothetical protein
MKALCITIFLLLPLFVSGQCKGIKVKEDKLRGTTTWYSSLRLPVGVQRIKTETTDSFFVVCNINNQIPVADTKGIFIAFSDSTYYRKTEQKARFNYMGDRFYYRGFIALAADSVKQIFLNKDIVTIGIGRHERTVTKFEAAALRRYVACILKD